MLTDHHNQPTIAPTKPPMGRRSACSNCRINSPSCPEDGPIRKDTITVISPIITSTVVVHVSSMNTSFSTSIFGSASIHARRACCTSSRSCSLACRVFFEGEIPFVQLMPQRAGLDRNALFGQPLAQSGQAQIGLLFDPGAQHGFHLSHARTAMTADLKAGAFACLLLPVPHLINPNAADFQTPRNRRRTFSAPQCPQHAIPQIL